MTEDTLRRFQVHGQDIPGLLAGMASARAEHDALVWAAHEGPPRRWTYRTLWRDVRALAAGLSTRGIRVGDRVLIHAENCPEMVLSCLACATVGAVAVTTNTKSVGPEMAFFAEHTRAVAAITQPQFATMLADAAPSLRWIAVTGDNSGERAEPGERQPGLEPFDSLAGDPEAWSPREVEPLMPWGIMFTSGTTSRPKAVVHTHANAVWASRVGPRNIDLGPDDVYLIYLPFFHVNAQSWSLFSVLGVGGTAVLMPKWSQSRFWGIVTEHEVTHISLMPFVIGALTGADRPNEHSLRVGVFGFVSPGFEQMLGIAVYGAYGMTETVTHCISGKPAEHLTDRAIGRVTPGYEIAVVDRATGELCTDGRTGELWVSGTRGIQLFLEYDRNPDANERAFCNRWFKTGDLVRMTASGDVVYVERDSDLLKVGGENVSAKEVEEVIVGHPAIQQAAVVAKPDDFLSEVPVAFVIPAPGELDEDAVTAEVLAACRERLASFKVPRRVCFVASFPTGTLDKVLKSELRAMAAGLTD
jgi:crotonobetaine/carnitine-CoA ligase